MSETDTERLRREAAEVEAQAETWVGRSNEYLVGYPVGRGVMQQNVALIEMQRRLLVAIGEFNTQSGKQADRMIVLTWVIVWLTVVLGVMTWLQF